jgi:CheY-like chemotaxis protein
VLVVDDDEVNRELVRSILAPLGAEIVEAAGGVEGVAAAAVATFDAILMDIHMPHLDGYAATAKIRHGAGPNWDAPIIAFSASLESPSSSAASGGGGEAAFTGFLPKPFASGDLVAAMQDCLGLRIA